MREIDATSPLIGKVSVHFFEESKNIFDCFKKEIERQEGIAHLGCASKVFTCINHTRLEYILLQCSVVQIISKFFKSDEELALSGKVRIPKEIHQISSGEELIKCWILLHSIGHTKYTFGTERILLKKCLMDDNFYNAILNRLPDGTKRWAKKIISNCEYEKFFKILSFISINNLKNNQEKKFFIKIFKTIALPIQKLKFSSSQEKEKIIRLREFYTLVRIISQIAIDSFYSHLPLEFKINQLLMNLNETTSSRRKLHELKGLFDNMGGFIAKETYLHPTVMALIAKYEKEGLSKLHTGNWRNNFYQFLNEVNRDGLKEPKLKDWSNLIRIILTRHKIPGDEIYKSTEDIEKVIRLKKNSGVTIVNNNFSGEQYVDISINFNNITLRKIYEILWSLYVYFIERAEKISKTKYRRLFSGLSDDVRKKASEFIENQRLKTIEGSMENFLSHGEDILEHILRFIVKPEYKINLACPSKLKPIGVKIKYRNAGEYNNLQEIYEEHSNFYKDNKDKMKELNGLKHEIDKEEGDFILCCFSSIKLKKVDGTVIDEWDGIILLLSENNSLIKIIEIKNKGTSSEAEAFKQLGDTKKYLDSRKISQTRRQRIKEFGANLTIK